MNYCARSRVCDVRYISIYNFKKTFQLLPVGHNVYNVHFPTSLNALKKKIMQVYGTRSMMVMYSKILFVASIEF